MNNATQSLHNPIGHLLKGYFEWMHEINFEPNIVIDVTDYDSKDILMLEVAKNDNKILENNQISINLAKEKISNIKVNKTKINIEYMLTDGKTSAFSIDGESAKYIYASEAPDTHIYMD